MRVVREADRDSQALSSCSQNARKFARPTPSWSSCLDVLASADTGDRLIPSRTWYVRRRATRFCTAAASACGHAFRIIGTSDDIPASPTVASTRDGAPSASLCASTLRRGALSLRVGLCSARYARNPPADTRPAPASCPSRASARFRSSSSRKLTSDRTRTRAQRSSTRCVARLCCLDLHDERQLTHLLARQACLHRSAHPSS